MICQRCGHCCCNTFVVVVKPEFVEEKLNVNAMSDDTVLALDNEECPHLTWDGDIANCKIHHYKWYKDTPCFSHGQIERDPKSPCRMGQYVRSCKEWPEWRNRQAHKT